MSAPTRQHPTTARGDWRARARCRNEDPELFHPVGTTGPALLQIAQAKSVCQRCPVRDACLAFALDALPHGVAGGMSEQERDAVRRSGRKS